MKTEATDELLEALLSQTKAVISAAQDEDIDEIGRLLNIREECLNKLNLSGDVGKTGSSSRRELIDEIKQYDKKACMQINRLAQIAKQEINNYQKKSKGLLKYNYGKYNLSSGQLIDKRD